MSLRTLANRLIEPLDNGMFRVSTQNAPAVESENARFDQVGPLRKANVGASLTASALTAGGVDADAPTGVVAGRAGRVNGIGFLWSAAVSAGAVSAQVSVNGTAKGKVFDLSKATSGVLDETTTVPFLEGDRLGVLLTTDGSFAPTTTDLSVSVLIRWDATGDLVAG